MEAAKALGGAGEQSAASLEMTMGLFFLYPENPQGGPQRWLWGRRGGEGALGGGRQSPLSLQIHMKTMPAAMFRLLTGQETPLYI